MTQIKETLLERYKLTQEMGVLNTPVTSKEAELEKKKNSHNMVQDKRASLKNSAKHFKN